MFKVINAVIFFLGGWEFLKLTFISSWSLANAYDSLSQQHQNFILIVRIVLSWTSPLTLFIHLKIYTLHDSLQRGKDCLWNSNDKTMGNAKETNKKMSTTKLSSSIIFFSSPWPFQKQDKDYFKWSVQNDKHQLLFLVVSFGESLYLKEVTH